MGEEFNPNCSVSYLNDFIDACKHSLDYDVRDAIEEAIEMYLMGKKDRLINTFEAYLDMRFPNWTLEY